MRLSGLGGRTAYEGTTSVTRRLLWYWTDPQATRLRPFFAQVEAIETFIWLREAVNRSNRNSRLLLEDEARRYNDEIVWLCGSSDISGE